MKKYTSKPISSAHKSKKSILKQIGYFSVGISLGTLVLGSLTYIGFEQNYAGRAYPGISIATIPVSGYTETQIKEHWLNRNQPFANLTFTFQFEDTIATLSGTALDIGFDATLSATQAITIGRSGSLLTDIVQKYTALTSGLNLNPLFRWREDALDETLSQLSQEIAIEPENALFEFENGRVTAFRPAKRGRVLDVTRLKKDFTEQLTVVATEASTNTQITFYLPVVTQEPLITTENANTLGIKELLGRGESYFKGSIAGRIHNLTLGASRINGVLIPPGKTFSFNQTVGDISAATGYKQAYIIKNGRTVLDDGGGICQVSTTLFRAALAAGLPIAERHAHSYRVSYYEQGGWKPGFDATVFAPTYDLKLVNDTQNYILIQTRVDPQNYQLIFELYGTKDNRSVEISPVKLWDAKAAPPPLYQDDPTLPAGTVKQVDWAAPGIKATFDYVVKKNDEEMFKKTFFSNFIPWQAVYLNGVGP